MIRRLLGPVMGPVLFVLAAAAVFAALGWVTHSALEVEQAQREAAARAELGSNLRVGLWRLDGRMLPALGVEDGRPYYQYGPSDPSYGYGVATTPLLVTSLPDWMKLHFQLDADGWGSPQVLSAEVAERVREAWPDLPLLNVNHERELVLEEIRKKFPARETLETLTSRDHAALADAPAAAPSQPSAVAPTDFLPAPVPPAGAEHQEKSAPSAPAPVHLPSPSGERKRPRIHLFGVEICVSPDAAPATGVASNSPRPEADALKKADAQNQFVLRQPPAAPGLATNLRAQSPKDIEAANNGAETISRAGTITRGMKEVQPPPGAGQSKNQSVYNNSLLNNSANSTQLPATNDGKTQTALAPGAQYYRADQAANDQAQSAGLSRSPMGGAGAPQGPAPPPMGGGGFGGGFGAKGGFGGAAPSSTAAKAADRTAAPASAAPAPPTTQMALGGGLAGSGRAGGSGAVPPPVPVPAATFAQPQPHNPEGAAQANRAEESRDKTAQEFKRAGSDGAPVAGRMMESAKGAPAGDRDEQRSSRKADADSRRAETAGFFYRFAERAAEKKPAATPNQLSEQLAGQEPLGRNAQLQLGAAAVPTMPPPVPPPAWVIDAEQLQAITPMNQAPTAPAPPQAIHLGSMHAQWIVGTDGSQILALVREARVDSRTVCQGIILDWPKLEAMLKDEVKDLFPNARLAPITDAATVSPEQAMSALPVQLDPGVQVEPTPAGWTTLRLGLALAWTAAIIVFLAVGFCGWTLIDLAERRIRFVSAVTHELRTPLTSLRLYLDLLVSGMIQDETKRQEYLNTLAAESDRLHRLIDNVLDFARLEKRRINRTINPTRVADILDQLRQAWTDRLTQEGSELVVISTLPAEQEVRTDAAMIQQIVSNLIDNARKYSRDSADRRIWVWARPAGASAIAFEVEDRGPGVPPGERRTIFKPFRRGSHADAVAGGAGLGLALAKSWAEVLGGRLSYRPADGGAGACFRLELALM